MIVSFETPRDKATYIIEHDEFISQLIIELTHSHVDNIKYEGGIPPFATKILFSDYLAKYGCTQLHDGFTGYFGFKSYRDTLQQFVLETASKYNGVAYALVVDVEYALNDTPESDISACIDMLFKK